MPQLTSTQQTSSNVIPKSYWDLLPLELQCLVLKYRDASLEHKELLLQKKKKKLEKIEADIAQLTKEISLIKRAHFFQQAKQHKQAVLQDWPAYAQQYEVRSPDQVLGLLQQYDNLYLCRQVPQCLYMVSEASLRHVWHATWNTPTCVYRTMITNGMYGCIYFCLHSNAGYIDQCQNTLRPIFSEIGYI